MNIATTSDALPPPADGSERKIPARYLSAAIREDLAIKMVFIGGPRQVGKTSLARSILNESATELNFDIAGQRDAILKRELPPDGDLFFDEIHKYKGWRNYLKGLFDQFGKSRRILVTGSARLDLYRHGGDSLQGRYFHFRLHPLSVAELGGHPAALRDLLAYGGFPEPFLRGSDRFSRRWSLAYRERLIREEVTSLEVISDLGKLELLAMSLPARVGSPLSLNSLREDLQVAHATVARWVDVLERLYAVFRIAPFGAPLLRAVKKERKLYHYDWSLVPDAGARFENLVASHLLKWVEYQVDVEGRAMELRYYRDHDGREVDFVIVEDGKPLSFIECKLDDAPVSPALRYLHARLPGTASWQISANGVRDYVNAEGIRVAPAARCLAELVQRGASIHRDESEVSTLCLDKVSLEVGGTDDEVLRSQGIEAQAIHWASGTRRDSRRSWLPVKAINPDRPVCGKWCIRECHSRASA